ncbi:NUDIX hydrolase [Deinococcus aerophilus]|uniref:DNA mismatch repair protein MutT n=1 Tax=Deinococcus aerophilus TaxID=522488 RepID=A0ABQ2GWR0_9DEIO|nr:NUDIX domain-containing protein [Deinococcus aerophilus]GGM15833.1 DNA mismatch repair protein MutT [Deinococcus aerophilus]
MRSRAVGILIQNHQVLLMLRRKEGRAYATLPGGGIEAGETPAEACARELLEEVNLVVDVHEEVLTLDNLGSREHYFRVTHRSGEMQLGNGPEGVRHSPENSYDPQWVDVGALDAVNLMPPAARPLVLTLLETP